MNNSSIGIFDSGVGGLTILSELQKLLPNESFVYVADVAFAPYGKRSITEVQTRTEKVSQFLLTQHVKLIVVACNTASTSSIKNLRKKIHIPVIGVVPVIKSLALVSKTKKAAVFATPLTIKSIYMDLLISKFGAGLTIYKEGNTGLESIIEKGDLSNSEIPKILKKHFLPLQKAGIDAIALGSTHFAFLRKQIQEVVGENVTIFDSGGAIARQVKRVLEAENLSSLKKTGEDVYYTTGEALNLDNVVEKLIGKKIKTIHKRI